ncbi:MAG: hypothetical protein AAF533_04045 [Acidobacteriota bacterium]
MKKSSLALLGLLTLGLLLSCARRAAPPTTASVEAPAATSKPSRAVSAMSAQGRSRVPQPTEHWLPHGAESENKKNRKAYRKQLHRAAPGTDWKAMEAENGRRLQELRNTLALRRGGSSAWTERGSRNQAGRMHAVALSLDGTQLYGGSDRGGVWTTAPDGSSWQPLSDNLWGGAHHLAVSSSPDELVTSMTNGGRIRYTTDGGTTWIEPAGLPRLNEGIRAMTDPADPTRVFLMVADGGRARLLRSIDGGLSYANVYNTTGSADFWMDRRVGGPLYVLDGTTLQRSDDAGDSWAPVGSIPAPADRVVLTGSEAGAPHFYAALRSGGWTLYRSGDGGMTWEMRQAIPDFWESLVASMDEPDLVITGGVETFRSDDGGVSFELVNPWGEYYGDPANKLHADVPGLAVLDMPGDGEVFFICTDGGLYRSDDGMVSTQNISLDGLGVSQYYGTHTSVLDPNRIQAGAQDQGYQASFGDGTPLFDFDQILSGDYAHLTSSDGTHQRVISVYPGFILLVEDPAVLRQVYLDFPMGENHLWLPPVLADPTDSDAFYFCATRLWKYTRDPDDDSWTMDLASDLVFQASGGNYLSALSISPVDTQRRIAVNDSGRLYYTDTADDGWTASGDSGPSSHYFFGNALTHSGNDVDLAYVGGSGYSGPGVYRTTDGGRNWSPFGFGLPNTLVYDLVFESPDSDVLYAATEAGPYRLDPTTEEWSYIGGAEAPMTTYWSVEAVPSIGVVRFGTYGRGIWDYQARTVSELGRCDDGIDNDGDGLVDCVDDDCVDDRVCGEICYDGVDNDDDMLVDCDDPDCDGYDEDGDTTPDCFDCAPTDPLTSSTPAPISRLDVVKVDDRIEIQWTDEGVSSGTGTTHDLHGDFLIYLAIGTGTERHACLDSDMPGRSRVDDFPAPSGTLGYWYVVSASNDCGSSGSGEASGGSRSFTACE